MKKPIVVHLVTRLQAIFALAHSDGNVTDRTAEVFEIDLLDEESFLAACRHFKQFRKKIESTLDGEGSE